MKCCCPEECFVRSSSFTIIIIHSYQWSIIIDFYEVITLWLNDRSTAVEVTKPTPKKKQKRKSNLNCWERGEKGSDSRDIVSSQFASSPQRKTKSTQKEWQKWTQKEREKKRLRGIHWIGPISICFDCAANQSKKYQKI